VLAQIARLRISVPPMSPSLASYSATGGVPVYLSPFTGPHLPRMTSDVVDQRPVIGPCGSRNRSSRVEYT
jgi:hypothetical protein